MTICFAVELGLRPVLRDGQLPLPGDRAIPLDHRNLVLLHQPLHAGVQLPRDLPRPVDDLAQVERGLLHAQPVSGGMGHIMIDLAGPQQRLGRDAPPVEADAAQFLALDDRHLQPELAGPDRRHIAAGARAQDDEIVSVRQCRLRDSAAPPALGPGTVASNCPRSRRPRLSPRPHPPRKAGPSAPSPAGSAGPPRPRSTPRPASARGRAGGSR